MFMAFTLLINGRIVRVFKTGVLNAKMAFRSRIDTRVVKLLVPQAVSMLMIVDIVVYMSKTEMSQC